MRSLATVVLLLSAAPAWGQAVKLPAEVKGQPAAFVTVAAEADGPQVRWRAVDPGLNLFPAHLLRDTRTAVVTAAAPGRYRLWAWTAKGDVPSEAAECVVVVGDAPPPVPPGPAPPAPPDDPFFATLQAAYGSDAGADKAGHKDRLASLYRQAGAKTVYETNLTTVAQFLAVVRAASANLLPASALPATRRALSEEMRKVLPTAPDAPLDRATRDLIARQFVRAADLLGAVK